MTNSTYVNKEKTLIKRIKAVKIKGVFHYNVYVWKYTQAVLLENYAGVITFYDRASALREIIGYDDFELNEYDEYYGGG